MRDNFVDMVLPVRAAQVAFQRLGRAADLPGLAASVGLLFVALACAALGLEIGALALMVISVLGELFFEDRSPTSSTLLQQATFGMPMRFVLRRGTRRGRALC